ncbi:DUF1801 domain-containing protein [Leptospira sp. GIMC2001]|uniref:DUF1801 domain-containing protein n=1 Tax=Leptospira sp. GIMC2001 TaxID=1513297 RepID=UPI00234A46B0|nr:DUF1801 domain-containing protein [Leptospira sp. GIMC2001]WCL49315.1 DUF1801 domain-containing protein [Leptospira sp. GIMC2001]
MPAKKKVKSDNKYFIKYEDKSIGQEHLIPIFRELRKLILKYKKGSIQIRQDGPGIIHLMSEKSCFYGGKNRTEISFTSALIQKGYVGFYFMPVYAESEIKKLFGNKLLSCLKGKSCFHIKELDKQIFKEIDEALAKGYTVYKENGYID